MKKHQISTKFLSIEKVAKIVARRQKIELSQEAIDAVLSTMTVDDFNALMAHAIEIQPLSE